MPEQTITEFLLARIAEDERIAQTAEPALWRVAGTWWLEGVEHEVVEKIAGSEVAFTHDGYSDHIARHDPVRVLAECEAKRRIVEHHRNANGYSYCDVCFYHETEVPMPAACPTLRFLAAVYASHPDYDQGWAL